MDLIYGFAACLCITLLGAGLSLLVPKGSLEGTVNLLCPCFWWRISPSLFRQCPRWDRLWDDPAGSTRQDLTQCG